MLESYPTHPGPMPSLVLVDPLAPPSMTSEEAVAMVKANFGYPSDMPDSIWRTEYGGYQHWYPRPGEPRIVQPLRVTDVWKVTATGERLVDYFIPGPDRDSTPDPKYVMAILIDDKARTIFEHRGYQLD
jgi:hypothetical protein